MLFVEGMREGKMCGVFFSEGEKEINKTRNGCARFYFIPLKGWLRDQMSVDGGDIGWS